MIGLLLAVAQLAFMVISFILIITGLWFSALVFIVLLAIHVFITPVSDEVLYYTMMASLIPSAFFFIRNILRMIQNIVCFFKKLIM